jgi:hypothetical protein
MLCHVSEKRTASSFNIGEKTEQSNEEDIILHFNIIFPSAALSLSSDLVQKYYNIKF